MTKDEALAELLRRLKALDYHFVAVTPATHARLLTQPAPQQLGLRDIFGWNRAFTPSELDPALLALLEAADAVEPCDGPIRSRVRVASLGRDLLLHSAFPTTDVNSVFFGPDTYRFARFIEQHSTGHDAADWLVDMGCGSGAGAIAAARVRPFERLTLVDRNPDALRLAQINAGVADVTVECVLADRIPAGADLIIANPPYMIDPAQRSYRDGGALLGGAVSLDWARQALAALVPGGTLLLYTGAAFIDGRAPLIDQLTHACADAGASLVLSEIDPDVFGDELGSDAYHGVERIAAIGAVITSAR